jgi:hypothetical protein
LKSANKNVKPQPKQYWKYVASFRKTYSISVQLEVGGKHSIELCEVADEF